jgi:hypothetical protein
MPEENSSPDPHASATTLPPSLSTNIIPALPSIVRLGQITAPNPAPPEGAQLP